MIRSEITGKAQKAMRFDQGGRGKIQDRIELCSSLNVKKRNCCCHGFLPLAEPEPQLRQMR